MKYYLHKHFSGSSAGDLGDVTPCNASPNLSAIINSRPIARHDTLETWTCYVQNMSQCPANTLHIFHQLQKLIAVKERKYIVLILLIHIF